MLNHISLNYLVQIPKIIKAFWRKMVNSVEPFMIFLEKIMI